MRLADLIDNLGQKERNVLKTVIPACVHRTIADPALSRAFRLRGGGSQFAFRIGCLGVFRSSLPHMQNYGQAQAVWPLRGLLMFVCQYS